VGAATFAKSVAGALDPKLGHAQRYTYSTETRLGLLTAEQGGDTPEVGPRAVPAGGVKTRTARGTPDWSGYPSVTFDHSWVSGPRGKTWPGRTLLLGDSFMWYALESLQPVFRQGRFIWLGKVPVDSLLRAIRRADTVVLESYAVFGSPLSAPAFRKAVAQALAKK
jgi:hypothetical protein